MKNREETIPQEILEKAEQLDYIVDTSPICEGVPFVLTDSAHPRYVAKNLSQFLVLDQHGLIPSCNNLGYGYYRYDTRHLSEWQLYLDNSLPSLLSAKFTQGYIADLLYTNTQSEHLAQQKVTMQRKIVLTDQLWELITLENYGSQPLELELEMAFRSDFADMFEVRGMNRANRGQRMIPNQNRDGTCIFLAYKGLDGVLLETLVNFMNVKPTKILDARATFSVSLPVREQKQLELCIATRWSENTLPKKLIIPVTGYAQAEAEAKKGYQSWCDELTTITTDNEVFNFAIDHCFKDIYILRQPTPKGLGIAAGIPWYSALFGRDSAITALQVLPYIPSLAKNCIDVLAAYQGQKTDLFQAERPGKILHELRLGELARLKEIPHYPYYGSVDATQLWLILLCEYIDWTGDLDYARDMWPAVRLALKYLDNAISKTGYMRYKRESVVGLENQGWKDSHDSVMHFDGVLAEPPIAICEAQAYLYLAWAKVRKLALLLGYKNISARLQQKCQDLKTRFKQDFWMESEQFVALALDKDGHQVRSVASNAGHCLWTGILDSECASMVADRLLSTDLFSGWGIRTLAKSAVAFNPISYHNGSVWPHDNGIIMEGLRNIGRVDGALKILTAMYEATQYQQDLRLPELFCGFSRQTSTHPIDYPVSCRPQGWASGTLLQMLKACINLRPDAVNKRLYIENPVLPPWLVEVRLNRLHVGNAEIDLVLRSAGHSTYCQVLRKQGDIKIIVEA
ncbi:MAG: amylo-alpha-1,6-glucosidase [Cyanobacteria bacterium]|nr:amylo-alpha-1,6-glucosidase [Cyanobacteriota bacterium]